MRVLVCVCGGDAIEDCWRLVLVSCVVHSVVLAVIGFDLFEFLLCGHLVKGGDTTTFI